MIKLLDALKIPESEYKNYKIHFATGEKEKKIPYNKFLRGEFKEWQEKQTQKNFERKYILSLIHFEKDIWLFGGVYEVLPIKPIPIEGINDYGNPWRGWKYQTQLTDIQNDLIGRVFVRYKKEIRQSYPYLESIPGKGEKYTDIQISYMLDNRVSIDDFNGFDEVDIDYETLQYIAKESIASWKAALSNVKGIYLICDRVTGKQYVGSAYGEDCIWQRWSNYAKDGHGGNVELKKLLDKNGTDYKKNFKYSILEVCNMNLGNDYIISRETHWKEVLMSREFGLNKN